MSEPILTTQDVLEWYESTSNHWRGFLTEHPEILALPCDIANTSSVGQLLQHIVAVELRYAERIARLPETTYEQIRYDSVDALYATHDRATALFNQSLANGINWDEEIDFTTRSYGTLRASLNTNLFHALLHSIRHYAQLGTLVRQQGYKPTWAGDYLFMGVQRV
jgi:uncharacterized damage-inducible protein DinB